MSKSKLLKLYFLLGFFSVCCVITLILSKYEEKKEEIKNSDEIILALDSDTITEISWEYEDVALSFHKDGVWLYDEDEAFLVDEEKIQSLLDVFKEFGVSFVIENVDDYSQYGLDKPECIIRLKSAEEEYKISLGTYSTLDEKRYVSIGDGNAYLVSEDPYDTFALELSDMLLNDEIPYLTQINKLEFEGLENYTILYDENNINAYSDDDVYFMNNKVLDTSKIEKYLDKITDLELSDYVSYNANEIELSEYGLLEPDLIITVEYPTKDEQGEDITKNLKLSLGRNQTELAEALESDDEDAVYNVTAYARVDDSSIIYQITSLNYSNLTAVSYEDLRYNEIVHADFDKLYQIDVELEGNEYSFVKEDGEDEDEALWLYNDSEIDIEKLESAITNIEADTFTTESVLGKEEICLTLHFLHDNYSEIQVKLYRYDGEKCIAVVDGKIVAFVLRSDVIELMESVNGIVLK